MEKHNQYAALIISQIVEMFNPDCENFIDREEFLENDNATQFFHALATLAPCHIYCKLTSEEPDILGFNHIANRLAFQYSEKEE